MSSLEEQIKDYLEQDRLRDDLRRRLKGQTKYLIEIGENLAQKVIEETKIRSRSFTVTLSFGDKDYSIYIENNIVQDIELTQPKPSPSPSTSSEE